MSRPKQSLPGASAPHLLLEHTRSRHAYDLSAARRALGEEGTETLVPLASALAQQGELALARDLLEKVLESNPNDPHALNTLGNVQRAEGKLEEAVASYRRAIEIDGGLASALSNCAISLVDLGRYQLALDCYIRAAEADPVDITIATNLTGLLFDLGRYDEAMVRVDGLLQRYPELAHAHLVKAVALLRRGHYAQGWLEYERRDRDAGRVEPRAYAYPEWDGGPITRGCLLVHAEQGLGDQIMFASCLGDLRTRVSSIVVECDARLKPLFARSFPDIRFYVQRKQSHEPWRSDGLVPSAQTWIGSLPMRFRHTRADFPKRENYLVADRSKVDSWALQLQALGAGMKIGISWRGGVPTTRRETRSIPLRDWHAILCLDGVHVVSLQYGHCTDEIEHAVNFIGAKIHHWSEAIANYDETAALVSALDLVISVQTSVVHLAGALGKSAWVLVPRIAEWRYGETDDTMPWYPSVRLFRQRSEGWDVEMDRLRIELSKLTYSPHSAYW